MKLYCKTCDQMLETTDFYVDKHRRTGYSSQCKECRKKRSSQWKIDNRERYNEYMREFNYSRKENKDEDRLAE